MGGTNRRGEDRELMQFMRRIKQLRKDLVLIQQDILIAASQPSQDVDAIELLGNSDVQACLPPQDSISHTDLVYLSLRPMLSTIEYGSMEEDVSSAISQCDKLLSAVNSNERHEPKAIESTFRDLQQNVETIANKVQPSLSDRVLSTMFRAGSFLMAITGHLERGAQARLRCEDYEALTRSLEGGVATFRKVREKVTGAESTEVNDSIFRR